MKSPSDGNSRRSPGRSRAAPRGAHARPPSPRAPSLTLECHCTYHDVRTATRTLRAFLEQHGLSPTEIDSWELVAVEAGNNAVKHATEPPSPLPVAFDLHVTDDQVELRVLDHTPGFELPPTATLPDPRSEHGRGLFLMRMLTDELRYLRGAGGNCLVIRKRRGPVPPRPPA